MSAELKASQYYIGPASCNILFKNMEYFRGICWCITNISNISIFKFYFKQYSS